MSQLDYINNRRKYTRPQGMLFSNNPGYISDGKRIPDGVEGTDFIILSDDNRGPINFTVDRLERRERTINGRMRSYHIADKLTISTAWEMLPSRSFAVAPEFQNLTETNPGKLKSPLGKDQQYTSDNGAGGVDLLDWYENYQGSFWVFLAYDKYTNLNGERDRLQEYSEVLEVFCSSFDYSVERRGKSTHDFWNISLSLEEV